MTVLLTYNPSFFGTFCNEPGTFLKQTKIDSRYFQDCPAVSQWVLSTFPILLTSFIKHFQITEASFLENQHLVRIAVS